MSIKNQIPLKSNCVFMSMQNHLNKKCVPTCAFILAYVRLKPKFGIKNVLF